VSIDFKEVYLKYYNGVFKYMMTLCRNENIAEEITQETFYKALKHINKYDENHKMIIWLCQIAKNTYYTQYNKDKRKETLNADLADPKQDFIRQLIDAETSGAIHKKIHELNEPYREVFLLRLFAGLSFAQIADIFDKTESWARVTYYRSKIKIRESINDREE
jgi:RNA polymerase sigma-70 factor (ECF subfamily)